MLLRKLEKLIIIEKNCKIIDTSLKLNTSTFAAQTLLYYKKTKNYMETIYSNQGLRSHLIGGSTILYTRGLGLSLAPHGPMTATGVTLSGHGL